MDRECVPPDPTILGFQKKKMLTQLEMKIIQTKIISGGNVSLTNGESPMMSLT